MKLFFNFLLIWCCGAMVGIANAAEREDQNRSMTELLEHYGYKYEIHEVTTEDKYILTLFRLLQCKDCKEDPIPYPTLLMHGLTVSSDNYVHSGPETGLAYILQRASHDVWLANCRGNTYSRKHETLSPDSEEFWDFSWHELGVYDLPACIKYILKQTGADKLIYIGHSQGTTILPVLFHHEPEIQKHLLMTHWLTPVVFMKHVKSPLFALAGAAKTAFTAAFEVAGNREVLRHDPTIASLGKAGCQSKAAQETVCDAFLFQIMGPSTEQFNSTLFPFILKSTPAGCSTGQLIHYLQLALTDVFCQYDHGPTKNIEKYGQVKPPCYDLSKITVKSFFYVGTNDFLGTPEDVQLLVERLPNTTPTVTLLPGYNHLDVLYAKGVEKELYSKIIQNTKEYIKNTTNNQN